MRLTSATLPLLALGAVSTHAYEHPQHPLSMLYEKIYDKVAPYIPEAYRPTHSPFASWASTASQAADEATAKVASKNVTPLTSQNWRSTVVKATTAPAGDGDVWLVYVTGGNKTCHGECAQANKAWNVRYPLPVSVMESVGTEGMREDQLANLSVNDDRRLP
jgi:hypothetical protein